MHVYHTGESLPSGQDVARTCDDGRQGAEIAINFLRRFHPATLWALAAFGPGNEQIGPARTFEPSESEAARRFIEKQQGRRNLYFTVNAVAGKPTKKPSKRDIAEIHWLHVDADLSKVLDWSDAVAVAAEQARVLELLRSYHPSPTVIVWSGGGYQAFWRLSEIVAVNGNKNLMAPIERRMRHIEKTIGADACHNADRIMRLPGTVNMLGNTKIRAGRKPAVAELVEFHDERIYDLEEFPEVEPARVANSTRHHPNAGSLDRTREALRFIPADDYDVYLRVGMALKAELGDGGFALYREWAASSIKFDDAEIRYKWATISPKGGITIATLFGLARDHGWREPWPKTNGAGRAHRPQRSEIAEDDTWNNPDESILEDRRGELPGFPADVLTTQWCEWLARASHGAGTTLDHVAVPLLSIASGLVGTARRIRASRSWSEPMSLWAAVVGFSGSGKTPSLDVTRRALSMIQRNRKDKVEALRRAHEKRAEAAKAASKKWKAEVQEAVENSRPPPDMPPTAVLPSEFIAPRLYASDVTIERLAVLLQARPRGMVMICDELAGLFLNMGRYSGGSDKEFWLESWNGQHYVVERQGRPPVVLDHLLVGLTGGFQPDKLARSFEGDDDGMYARVLFAWPQESDFRRLSNAVSEIEPEFQTALMRLIDLPAGDGDVFAPLVVALSATAIEFFEQFRQFLHEGKGALDGREREWWMKGATHVLRMAGTLCYLDWAMRGGDEPAEIAPEFVTASVRLWQGYFWPHARAALRQIGLSDRHANARRALKWIRAHREATVSLMDVRRDALSQRLDAEQTEQLLDDLVRAGWLKKMTTKTGGRPANRWSVNPQLLSS